MLYKSSKLSMKYYGLAELEFKKRHSKHKPSFNIRPQNHTTLSSYIWKLQDKKNPLWYKVVYQSEGASILKWRTSMQPVSYGKTRNPNCRSKHYVEQKRWITGNPSTPKKIPLSILIQWKETPWYYYQVTGVP